MGLANIIAVLSTAREPSLRVALGRVDGGCALFSREDIST